MNIKHSTGHETTKRMKNFLLWLYFFAFIVPVCQAQPYESIFGEESTSWNVLFDNSSTDSLSQEGDTLIAGKSYKKLLRITAVDTSLYFLNEDSITGRVHFFTASDTALQIILDLSLQVGDSLFIAAPHIFKTLRVDSVYFKSGRKHIQFNEGFPGSQYNQFTFIEGLGSSLGLLYPESGVVPGIPFLLCSWKDSNHIYHDSTLSDSCYVQRTWSSTENKIEQGSTLIIFPNPCNDIIGIKSQEQNIYNITIFNMSGREVINRRLSPDRPTYSVQLNIEKFPSGIYFLSVETQEETVIEKIIKL